MVESELEEGEACSYQNHEGYDATVDPDVGLSYIVRIQLGQGSAAHVTTSMLKNEGITAFYKGLSAGLLRQATYTTARLGSFNLSRSIGSFIFAKDSVNCCMLLIYMSTICCCIADCSASRLMFPSGDEKTSPNFAASLFSLSLFEKFSSLSSLASPSFFEVGVSGQG